MYNIIALKDWEEPGDEIIVYVSVYVLVISLICNGIVTAAYPSNVASAISNTSISVSWSTPDEFYSSIIQYRLVSEKW